eukprot:COSAG01_NODE_5285_length_4356_cov_44.815833_5_plen_106_part_00
MTRRWPSSWLHISPPANFAVCICVVHVYKTVVSLNLGCMGQMYSWLARKCTRSISSVILLLVFTCADHLCGTYVLVATLTDALLSFLPCIHSILAWADWSLSYEA